MDEVILLMKTLERKQCEEQFWSHIEKTPEGYEQAIKVLLKMVKSEDLAGLLGDIEDWESIIWDESVDN